MIKRSLGKRGMLKVASWSQILILIIGTIAISWALGSSIGEVSGAGSPEQIFSGGDAFYEPRPIPAEVVLSDVPPATPAAGGDSITIIQEAPTNGWDLFKSIFSGGRSGGGSGVASGGAGRGVPTAAVRPVTKPAIELIGSGGGTNTAGQTLAGGTLLDSNGNPIPDDLFVQGGIKQGVNSGITPSGEVYNFRVNDLKALSGKITSVSSNSIQGTLGNVIVETSGGKATLASLFGGGKTLSPTTIESLESQGFRIVQESGTINSNSVTQIYHPESGRLYSVDAVTGNVQTQNIAKQPSVFGLQTNYFLGSLLNGVIWGAGIAGVILLLGNFLPEQYQPYVKPLAAAVFGGFTAGGFAKGVAQTIDPKTTILNKNFLGLQQSSGMSIGIGVGLIVAAAIFYFMYKEESKELVTFTCEPWDAPTGGKNCELCNNQPGGLPCSEYQCRSLGQACQLLNPGTGEEKCEWVNPRDVEQPTIEPWKEVLSIDHEYTPDNAINPPDRGVIIERTDSTTGCIKAFTPLVFGVQTNEPAKCKIDYVRKDNYEAMQFHFGGSSLFNYNHTQVMSLPGPSAAKAENLTIENDGDYELFVRCQDANGNANVANFVFKFCVEKGPDTTAPVIVTTNLLDDMPVAYNQSELDIELYTNEPAKCKWSTTDQSFKNMEETMKCSSRLEEINTQMVYTCSSTLTGIRNRDENNFFFRCEDNEGNQNAESYEFTVMGSEPLVIEKVAPNKTISDHTSVVKVDLEVTTTAGYDKGRAICYYSQTGEEDDYIMFADTDNENRVSKQEQNLVEGSYTYYFKCVDLGGNTDYATTSFKIETDNSPPLVLRAYKEETYLKLTTDEAAQCVYDTTNCLYDFDDGKSMAARDDVNHYTDWKTDTSFYVKCKDKYDNEPLPDKCSIVVKPFRTFETEEED